MKKVLRILAIVVGVILLLLILTPLLFKSKIETMVKQKVNEQVQASVDWSRFSVSFFRGFPNLSISLQELTVVGEEPFKGDTLAGLQRFELRVKPFSALKKNLVVKSILLERPLINGIVLEDGTANWDIMNESQYDETEEVSDESASPMTLSLERFSIKEGRIYYGDASEDLDVSMEEFNMELRGDFSKELSDMKVSAGIERINAKMGGIRYLRDGVLSLDMMVAVNMTENRYTLKENLISLNGLTLGVEGEVILLESGAVEMDLRYFSRETSFQTLLSLIPAIYLQDFESLKTSGSLQLDGTITGTMKDSILPDATMKLLVKDGYFAYPDLPGEVTDVQISLHADYRGADLDASKIELEKFHLVLGTNPFELSMLIDHPVSDMHVAGSARGTIDFASLKEFVPMEETRLEGRLETDLRWDTKLSYIENEIYEKVDMDGSLNIEGMVVETPEIAVPVMLEKMTMLFNPSMVELTKLDMKLGSSDLHMDGELENFIPYIFDGQILSGRLNVSSSLLDANELIPAEENEALTRVAGDTLVPVPPDSLAQPATVRIPEDIDFTMTLDMQRVDYQKITIQNIKGKVRVMEGVAGLEQLSMDLIGGSLTSTGWVDTRGEFAETDVSLVMKGVDISSAYETFITLEKLAPMVRFISGRADIDMEYHSFLDKYFAPLYESINARGEANTEDLQLFNLEEFIPMGEVLKNEKFSKIAPDEVQVGFTVKDGRVIFNPFNMDMYNSHMIVSGSHGIDLTMDYTLDMKIARTDLGAGANQMMQGMTALAAGAGLKIPQSDFITVIAHLGGTFNHPKVTTDLSGNLKSTGVTVKTVTEEKITEELEKVEAQVRDDASEKAEKIIKDAEEEAARLVEEARKTGEQLVKEAEIQGDKLIKEAGSNPLKQVAAKKASAELIRQAEKQSETLVNEAEIKAAEVIQNARNEADKI
jgi:uncharacterized protein involved in outer membrane biogenesis